MVPESAGRAAGPLVKVTLCEVGLSFQVQVTLLPFFTTTLEGLNEMFCRLTAPEVGGAAAVAENVSVGSVVIAGVAAPEWGAGAAGPRAAALATTPARGQERRNGQRRPAGRPAHCFTTCPRISPAG